MKLRMTDDFKKAAKGMVIYVITAIVVFPVFHLIKGDFSWDMAACILSKIEGFLICIFPFTCPD